MPELEPKELVNVKEFIENGRFDKASQALKDFGQREDISQYEQIAYYILISFLSDKLKDKEKQLDYAEKAYHASLGQKESLQLVDVYIVKSSAYCSVYKYEEALALLLQSEKMLKSLYLETTIESTKRNAEISCLRAKIYSMMREFDKALEYAEETLILNKKLDLKLGIVESLDVMKNIYFYLGEFERSLEYLNQCLLRAKEINYKAQILNCYTQFGIIYAFRGEVDSAIEHYNKALAIAKEIDYKFGIAQSLNNLGDLYRKQGRFNLARETLEKSVIIFKELGISGVTSIDCLFHLALEKGDLELAQKYLDQLKRIRNHSKLSSMAYRLDKAVFLKTSPRSIHRGKAEETLKQIVEEEIFDYEVTLIALLHLCDLLLNELQNTGDLEIIDEIKPCIVKLLDLAEKNHSYPLLAEVYIFQSRLALVTLELNKARKLLTKAQNIADKYHLNRLAVKISTEHDELLKHLKRWEGINESNTSLSDRMKLASLNEQMGRMIRNGAIERPEVRDEEPIVLIIMSKSGISYFKYPFKKDWDFEWIFSSFMSAFDTFSSELFSESIDRIKIGENQILINPIESFLVCYIIKGQSYPGLQRLHLFSKTIKDNNEIWTRLKRAAQIGEVLELNKIPSLGAVINEIFNY
ncbi:MAG: tetratricopeptide repeat protein [Candidatus Hermodarchaeota archaeon]